MLAYGSPADLMDEAFGIAETTTLECLIKFVQGIDIYMGRNILEGLMMRISNGYS
jgi:hypothetical protein